LRTSVKIVVLCHCLYLVFYARFKPKPLSHRPELDSQEIGNEQRPRRRKIIFLTGISRSSNGLQLAFLSSEALPHDRHPRSQGVHFLGFESKPKEGT
jgi:hypothetical protein